MNRLLLLEGEASEQVGATVVRLSAGFAMSDVDGRRGGLGVREKVCARQQVHAF